MQTSTYCSLENFFIGPNFIMKAPMLGPKKYSTSVKLRIAYIIPVISPKAFLTPADVIQSLIYTEQRQAMTLRTTKMMTRTSPEIYS